MFLEGPGDGGGTEAVGVCFDDGAKATIVGPGNCGGDLDVVFEGGEIDLGPGAQMGGGVR